MKRRCPKQKELKNKLRSQKANQFRTIVTKKKKKMTKRKPQLNSRQRKAKLTRLKKKKKSPASLEKQVTKKASTRFT